MYSSQTFRLDSNNVVRYIPNEHIRTVAVYAEKIEFDAWFDTNNLGFVDNQDYGKTDDMKEKYYAFIGDSFVTGHGVGPWIPELRDNIQAANSTIEIYNLGVDGIGVEQFYGLLKSASEQIKITNIVMLPISNDFYRQLWYPLTTNEEIRFCPISLDPKKCAKGSYIIRVINGDASQEEILDITREMKKNGNRYVGNQANRRKSLWEYSHLYLFVKRSYLDIYGTQYSPEDKSVKRSLAALKNIRELFPDAEISLIHLPEKGEVAKHKYSLEIRQQIEELGIKYYPALTDCEWSTDMFWRNDAHPNRLGYTCISSCVYNYLFREENSSGE